MLHLFIENSFQGSIDECQHVQDQGIGLDNVDIKKLFTRFYQGKHNEGGSGIGLSYAKMLIDLHGGRSCLSSTINSEYPCREKEPDSIFSSSSGELKILLTARADSESQMLGYKLGADAYLPKPFEMEMLLSVIQSRLAGIS